MTSTRKVFAPIPARALRDQRLSSLQLRLLGAIALFDRMGRNGQGCWAGHELLSEIAACAYTSVSTELGRLRQLGYITTSKHPKNQRKHMQHVIYNDEDSSKFRKRNSSASAEPSDSSSNAEQFGKTPENTSSGFATFPNENKDRRVAIDREVTYSVETEKYSAKAARSPNALSQQDENVGATLARLERELQFGNSDYHTASWRDWLYAVSEDYGRGEDPNAGRAYRLLQKYFPDDV